MFAFGIGSSVNRHLIEGMARAGQGEAFVVTQPDQAAAQAEHLRKMIESPVLTQVKARFEGLDVYDVEPAQLPDVLGGRPVVLFGKWRGEVGAPVNGKLIIEGRAADGPYRNELSTQGREDQTSSALRHLWARQRIASLSDQEALEGGSAQKAAITALGLKYSLLTQYTSFIAVDQRVRNPNPALTPKVDQPSPMPEGVSDAAIGAEVPSTPEPAALMALLVVDGGKRRGWRCGTRTRTGPEVMGRAHRDFCHRFPPRPGATTGWAPRLDTHAGRSTRLAPCKQARCGRTWRWAWPGDWPDGSRRPVGPGGRSAGAGRAGVFKAGAPAAARQAELAGSPQPLCNPLAATRWALCSSIMPPFGGIGGALFRCTGEWAAGLRAFMPSGARPLLPDGGAGGARLAGGVVAASSMPATRCASVTAQLKHTAVASDRLCGRTPRRRRWWV